MKADNNLNALGTFFQRKKYEKESFSSLLPTPIDLWTQKKLYGKVDFFGHAVFPSEAFLKPITSLDDQKFVINFVADAFEDLRKFMLQAIARGKLSQNSKLINLQAVSGWESVNDVYHTYMTTLFSSFADYMKEKNREQSLFSFEKFFNVIEEFFLEISSKGFPITRTSFIKSKFCSNHISGLMIEIASEQHDNDQIKIEQFIKDENFSFFSKAARRYGFKLDKNAPWRLIADIKSPNMKRFLDQNTISLDNIFERVYYLSYEIDKQLLINYLISYFNSYIVSIQSVKQERLIDQFRLVEKRSIKQSSRDDLIKLISDQMMIRLLAGIRSNEENIQSGSLSDLIDLINDVYFSLGIEAAIKFLNEKVLSGDISRKNVRLSNENIRFHRQQK